MALSGHSHVLGNGYSGYRPAENLYLGLTIVFQYNELFLTRLVNNVQLFIQTDEYTKKLYFLLSFCLVFKQ